MTQRPSAPSSAGTYVYGIALAEAFGAGSPALASPGIGGGGGVRTVTQGDLVALVSDAPSLRARLSRENLAAHQRVLEEAIARADVLPVSFGTVATSDEEVRHKLLGRNPDQLHGELARIRGCVELDLRVLWRRERLFAEVVADDDEIRTLRDRLSQRPPESSTYERVHLGQLVEAAVTAKQEQEAEVILGALEPLAIETRVNDNTNDTMVLNASFLVEKPRVPAFDARVEALGAQQERRLVFRYIGPLAPYNFVNLSVDWDD
jgi:hypothetical protein